MNTLPFAEQAFADDREFLDSGNNPEHSIGEHKAQAFTLVFGITLENWVVLS